MSVLAPLYTGPALSLAGKPPLRVAHVASSVAPTVGGPATVIARMAAAQAALGHDVTIISTLAPEDREMFQIAARCIPHFDKVRLLLAPWPTSLSNRMGLRAVPIFEALFPYVDVVHLHGVWEPILLQASRVARRHRIPYIVRPCGVLHPWSLQQSRWKKKLALALTHRHMLDHAALIHMLNADEDRLVKPLGIKAPTTIISNGVFLDEVDDTPSDDRLFDRFPTLREHPYILFLGRLHYKKGLDILAEAFARVAELHPDVELLVAGPDGGAQSDFQKRIARHSLQSRVHLAGPLVGPAKFTAYRQAACFCLPSRQEGFSLSITEALASRLPVAISESCYFPQVQEIGAGRVFSLTAEATAEALHEILSASPHQICRMTDAGRSFVEAHLTWERVAELTTEAYEGILQRV